MSDCPCNGCVPPKRHEACHDSCKEYIVWKQPLIDSYEERKRVALQRQNSDGMTTAIHNKIMFQKRGR